MWNCLVESKVLCSAGYLFIISNNSKFILQTLDAYDSTLKEYYFCLPNSQFSANSDVHVMAFSDKSESDYFVKGIFTFEKYSQ